MNGKFFLFFLVVNLQAAIANEAAEVASGHHVEHTIADLKFNIINFFIFAFLIY